MLFRSVSEDLIEAGGGSLETLYHKEGRTPLNDFGDRLACTTYEMGGLPDINTERPSFQKYFFNYINDCIACGADGFRYDTAKHIGLSDDPKEDDGFKNNFWEKATKEVIKDGWFYTGDLAKIDSEGYIFICGRRKSVIVLKNGKNIFPEEMETLINKEDGVEESFIFGKPISKDPNDIKIFVKI